MNELRRIAHLMIASSLLIGLNCAAPRKGVTISMSPELNQMNGNVSAAWLTYGLKKALWRTKIFFEKNPGESTYVYTLAEEVDCRKSLADIWVKMDSTSGSQDTYLDELTAVVQADFITEYVWKYLRQSGWTQPEGLQEETFEAWVRDNLKNHTCITLASASSTEGVSVQEKQYQQQKMLNKAVTAIAKNRFAKAEVMLVEILNAKPEHWKAFFLSNDSLYCAFWDAHEQQQCIKQYPDKTVVPFFPSYSRVHYLLGFIKVETGNPEGALAELNKAAVLQPDHPVILLEKGAILSKLKRSKAAYDCFVLAERPHYATTPFTTARALRGQGITLIDLGNLDEAELCFEKSLKYDPDNSIAVSEVEYIRRIRSGKSTPGADLEINRVREK